MEKSFFEKSTIEKYEIDCYFIRKRRAELDYAQIYMAFCLGYKRSSSYYKCKNGDQEFKAIHLPILAQLLSCDINDLIE